MHYLSRTGPGVLSPSPKLSASALVLDIRRRGIDPFLSGVVIGAAAAVAGMLLGFYLLVPI